MIIDAKNMIAGRIATVAAKKALLGEKIDIINAESAIITGKKAFLKSESQRKRDMGIPTKGPFISRMPDRYLRRIIRGMLPYKQEKGRKAFKRIMCYLGTPLEFEGKETLAIESANVSKVANLDYATIGDVCKKLGWKQR